MAAKYRIGSDYGRTELTSKSLWVQELEDGLVDEQGLEEDWD